MMWLVDGSQFLVYLAAATVLAIIPGPGVFYVLARTISGGKTEGVASTIGTSIGGLIHVGLATVGLTAALAASPESFKVIKLLGVVYLIYLGSRTILSANESSHPLANLKPAGNKRAFVEGVITEALNIKTALFFLAFIPQFINHELSVARQVLLYGVMSVMLNTLVDLLVVLLTTNILPLVQGSSSAARLLSCVSGSIMILLGLFISLSNI